MYKHCNRQIYKCYHASKKLYDKINEVDQLLPYVIDLQHTASWVVFLILVDIVDLLQLKETEALPFILSYNFPTNRSSYVTD